MKNILNYKKPTGWVILIAMIVCAIAVFGFMTNKKEKAGTQMLVSQKEEIEDSAPIQYYYGNAIEAEVVDVDKTNDVVSKLTESDFEAAKEWNRDFFREAHSYRGLIYITDIKELSIKIYYYDGNDESDESAYLIKNGDTCEVFPMGWIIKDEKPSFSCFDYDGDGDVEIAMTLVNEERPTMNHQDLYIFDKQQSGHYQVFEYGSTCYESDIFPYILSWYSQQGINFTFDCYYPRALFKANRYVSGDQYGMILNFFVKFHLEQPGKITVNYESTVEILGSDTKCHEGSFDAEVSYEGNGDFRAKIM